MRWWRYDAIRRLDERRALREGGEEGEAEGLALMRDRRLPPPECLNVEPAEILKRHDADVDDDDDYYDMMMALMS